MVWMMLKERKELQDKLEAQTASYKALEVPALAPLRFPTRFVTLWSMQVPRGR